VRAELKISERRACAALGQHRSTQRKPARGRDDEAALTADIIELAKTYGRYGYRRVTALLRHAGWAVNAKRVQRIWRREGLKVPHKQPKRGRLWLNDGSCVRLRAERPNHVWSYDFVEDRTHDGRKFRMLCLIDEFTHEALAIRVKRKLNSSVSSDRRSFSMPTSEGFLIFFMAAETFPSIQPAMGPTNGMPKMNPTTMVMKDIPFDATWIAT
jgi:putative transposase